MPVISASTGSAPVLPIGICPFVAAPNDVSKPVDVGYINELAVRPDNVKDENVGSASGPNKTLLILLKLRLIFPKLPSSTLTRPNPIMSPR